MIQRIKTDMLQLKTILKFLYPADVVLLFLKTSFLLHSMMLRGSSFQRRHVKALHQARRLENSAKRKMTSL